MRIRWFYTRRLVRKIAEEAIDYGYALGYRDASTHRSSQDGPQTREASETAQRVAERVLH